MSAVTSRGDALISCKVGKRDAFTEFGELVDPSIPIAFCFFAALQPCGHSSELCFVINFV